MLHLKACHHALAYLCPSAPGANGSHACNTVPAPPLPRCCSWQGCSNQVMAMSMNQEREIVEFIAW